jgi:hypothetical protein
MACNRYTLLDPLDRPLCTVLHYNVLQNQQLIKIGCEKDLSEVGFEPTPSYEDQNSQPELEASFRLSLAP